MFFLRGSEKKEYVLQSRETWVKRCEAARRAEDAAREAEHIFKISVERFLAAKEVEEARSKEVAEKPPKAITRRVENWRLT